VARVDARGEPRWVATAEPASETSHVTFGSLSMAASGEVLAVGGSNGPVTVGGTSIPSTAPERGQSWVWRLGADDGATRSVQSWQASVGYYAHLQRGRAFDDFLGLSGALRGEIDFDGQHLSAGMGRPEDPISPFAVAYDPSTPLWSRAFITVPFDAFHGVDVHLDWNVCREAVAVVEGLQGSSGATPIPPVSQADFGAGLVMVPENTLQFVQWSRDGTLAFRSEHPLGAGEWRVRDAAWSPSERAVVVVATSTSGFVETASIRRFAFH
jgi:hypothetical protein